MAYTKEYLEYLESTHWHNLREMAFNRVNRKCEVCSLPKKLQGHHLIYRSRLEDGIVDDIMCLCGKCHDLWHEWLRATGRKLHEFCRQSTRGALLVLGDVKWRKKEIEKPEPRPVYIPLNPPKLEPKQKMSKKDKRTLFVPDARNATQKKMMEDPVFVQHLTMKRRDFLHWRSEYFKGCPKYVSLQANSSVIYDRMARRRKSL